MRIRMFMRQNGFSMLDLLCLLAGLAGIAAVVLPMMARSRRTSCHASCTNNLKQVGIGVRSFVMDGNLMSPQQVSVTNGGLKELVESGSAHAVFRAMSNDLVSPRILFCPQEKAPHRRMAYVWETTVSPNASAGTIPFTTNNLSYFMGIDATEIEPQRILAGDDHFQVAQSKPKPGLLLLASLVDYPLRTPLLASLFAFCCVELARSCAGRRCIHCGWTTGAVHLEKGAGVPLWRRARLLAVALIMCAAVATQPM